MLFLLHVSCCLLKLITIPSIGQHELKQLPEIEREASRNGPHVTGKASPQLYCTRTSVR